MYLDHQRPPKAGTIALPPSSLLILRDHYVKCRDLSFKLDVPFNDDTLVFCHVENGKPIRPDTVTRAFRLYAERVGLPTGRFHDLRHTHATLMLKQGVHPKIVSERLGHSTIAITLDTYSHVLQGLQEQAAMRFEESLRPQAVTNRGVNSTLDNKNKVIV